MVRPRVIFWLLHCEAAHLKEMMMSKTRKTRLISLGGAKRLTRAQDPVGSLEINPLFHVKIG